MELNNENIDTMDRIERILRKDDDSNGTPSLSSSDLSPSDTSNGTSSQSNGNSPNDEIIFFNPPVLVEDRVYVHPPLNPVQFHQPPMDQIVMTPGDACNCTYMGLPNCARENQDFLIAEGFNADTELERARNIHNRLDGEANNKKRKALYRRLISVMNWGPMVIGERRRLPNCLEAIVRRLYPETSGLYMGFRDANAQYEEMKEEI